MTLDVAAFLDEIDALLDDERYLWAARTLRGIAGTVRQIGHVTDTQRLSVANIKAGIREPGGLPSDKYRSSRRYEGWEPTAIARRQR
jgi:hypothetical protein